jgi:hypothetical protein
MERPKYLLIDSKDKISGVSHNFQVQLKPALRNVKSMTLLSTSIPLSNYIINDNNNILRFTDGVTDFTATIVSGIYDYVTILTAIKTAMEATAYAGTITVTYDIVTYKFTITSTTPIILQFLNTTNSIAYILGFNAVNTGSAVSHIADSIGHLSTPPCLYITLDCFPNNCRTTNNEDNCTFIIFSQTISGHNSLHTTNTNYKIDTYQSINSIQNFNVCIKERGGLLFNMNGVDWCMMLEVEYYN